AVTFPPGMSKSMSTSACTAPKLLLTPWSRSRASAEAEFATAVPVPAPTASVVTTALLEPGGRARGGNCLHAQLVDGRPVVLDDRGCHVGGSDPLRRQQQRLHVGVGLRVLGGSVHEHRGDRLSGPEVQGDRNRGLRLGGDRLVHGS